MKINDCDFLIIGSGLAGLATALNLSSLGKVHILSKENLDDSNTSMAQGGIASVTSTTDSFQNHIQDTLNAGAGLCHPEVVRNVVEQAPDRIKQLQDWGVEFDKTGLSEISLTREGGHSEKRILHVEDQTGRAIHNQLLKRALSEENISFSSHHIAIDLIVNKQLNPFKTQPTTCIGCYSLDTKNNEVVAWRAKTTVLATGGAGKTYLYTSNWSGATGDGIALGFRAGARVANMEFMQFHPTCLHHHQAGNFLISEALRGEGARLVNSAGHEFMQEHHCLAELAPRDIVARGIDAEIKKTGADCVFLDISHKPTEFIKNRFPVIYERCLKYGIDITRDKIPVIPAAHYLCGGLVTNQKGQTDVNNLYAIGETACTGLHGANRLASNSLLECMAYSYNAYEYLKNNLSQLKTPDTPIKDWISPEDRDDDELIVISHIWDEIRRLMWNYVGIVRSHKRLRRAQTRLDHLLQEIREYYAHFQLSTDLIELRNIALVAKLTVESALRRPESIGIHYNIDTPSQENSSPEDTVIFPGQF